MELIKSNFLQFFELLALREGWSQNYTKFTLFLMLLATSFTAYFIFKALGIMSVNDMNTLAENLYQAKVFGVAVLAGVYGSLGLYCSVLSMAIINALVPKA
ncbi:hypothetical protein [Microbulbifer taiwanensis]|uniref:ABC transporter permease n=1 Tax=Microbulbifer taiwanensis TaxID=986746 RepID=A0ABW1YLP1_9GAMM|nr:hypothetical protein [Microbulbifer taiwanensis]